MNKKTAILFLALITISFSFEIIHKKKEVIDFKIVNQEVKEFINKAKEESVSGGKYNVYVIKFTKEKNGYCVTYGYFFDRRFFPDILKNKRFYRLDNELVLVDIPISVVKSYSVINTHFEQLNDENIIKSRISPSPIMGAKMGNVCCYRGSQAGRDTYDDDLYVPKNLAIFKYKETQTQIIELDSSSLRKEINGQ